MRKARVDDNQAEIVAALRHAGAEVQVLSEVGKGCPDLAVAYRGLWFMLEVKDNTKPPSKQQLTPAEAVWHTKFSAQAPVHVVHSVEEALDAIDALDAPPTTLQITVDLRDKVRPTAEQLAKVKYDELEYWINMVYADPPLFFDGAVFELF